MPEEEGRCCGCGCGCGCGSLHRTRLSAFAGVGAACCVRDPSRSLLPNAVGYRLTVLLLTVA